MTQSRQRPWYRHYWVWLIMMPPLAAVVAGLWTVVIAARNAPSLVVDDYRRIGMANHLKQERDLEAARLGLHGELRLAGAALTLRVDADPEVLNGNESLTLQLFHPTLPDRDAVLMLRRIEDQAYSATLPPLSAANYHLQLLPAQGGWRLVGRWQNGDSSALLAPAVDVD